MAIINTGLTTTAANIYAAATNSAIVTIHLCNYSNATQTVNIFVVPVGTIANTTNMIYSNLQIAPTNTYIVNSEKFILTKDFKNLKFEYCQYRMRKKIIFIRIY